MKSVFLVFITLTPDNKCYSKLSKVYVLFVSTACTGDICVPWNTGFPRTCSNFVCGHLQKSISSVQSLIKYSLSCLLDMMQFL